MEKCYRPKDSVVPKDIFGTKFYTPIEVSKIMGLTTITVWGYLKTKKLKGRKIGGRWYISEPVLKRFFGIEEETKGKKRAKG